MRVRDTGLIIGELAPGKLNKISDVPGVTVGHATINTPDHQTGVTVVMPCGDNPFLRKLPCAGFVLNGFGKTAGLVQIEELGTLETPIALTNTLNVGLVWDALAGYMVNICAADGVDLRSVNPVVCECNDAYLNHIAERAVKKEHVLHAIETACADFEEGAVGCGRGVTCHGLKGGVGSASRVFCLEGQEYHMGVLIQTNHGRLKDLRIDGKPFVGEKTPSEPDKGSYIVILATDAPLSDRQLKRVLKRCAVGPVRLGSYIGHGSGEVFVGFSTANRFDWTKNDLQSGTFVNEECIDLFFRAAAESTEEAMLNALYEAGTVTGYRGHTRVCLRDYAKEEK